MTRTTRARQWGTTMVGTTLVTMLAIGACGSATTGQTATTAPVTGPVTVTDQSGSAAISDAVARYTTWVDDQLSTLVTATNALSAAVAPGQLDQPQTAYGSSRLAYERLEPIAELFPDLDDAMDAREDDFPQGVNDPTFTGWHRIEYLLYGQSDVTAAAPFATELAQNAAKLQTQVGAITIDPDTMVNGAAGLIEEAAASKITGEEDRYSQLSLVDLAANVEGAQQIVNLLAPQVQAADPALLTSIQQHFTAFDRELKAYEVGDGFQPYDQLATADRNQLKATLAALSEHLAQMPAALKIEIK